MKQTVFRASLYACSALFSFVFLGLLLAPLSASALGLSFGGRIVAWVPCVGPSGPSFWITIVPAGGSTNVFFIWGPGTLGIPPAHIGQAILGVADTPYACFTTTIPPVPLYGQRMQIDGVSI